MLSRELKNYLFITLGWLFLLTILRFEWNLSLFALWLGGILGVLIFDLDHLLYALVISPKEEANLKIKGMLEKYQFKELFLFLKETKEERVKLRFHNAVFQTIFFVPILFVLSSTSNLFGKALVMGMALHLLIEEFNSLAGNNFQWLFWPIKGLISLTTQKRFLLIMFLIFVFLNFFLL